MHIFLEILYKLLVAQRPCDVGGLNIVATGSTVSYVCCCFFLTNTAYIFNMVISSLMFFHIPWYFLKLGKLQTATLFELWIALQCSFIPTSRQSNFLDPSGFSSVTLQPLWHLYCLEIKSTLLKSSSEVKRNGQAWVSECHAMEILPLWFTFCKKQS